LRKKYESNHKEIKFRGIVHIMMIGPKAIDFEMIGLKTIGLEAIDFDKVV